MKIERCYHMLYIWLNLPSKCQNAKTQTYYIKVGLVLVFSHFPCSWRKSKITTLHKLAIVYSYKCTSPSFRRKCGRCSIRGRSSFLAVVGKLSSEITLCFNVLLETHSETESHICTLSVFLHKHRDILCHLCKLYWTVWQGDTALPNFG
jgi:hypothetical protein